MSVVKLDLRNMQVGGYSKNQLSQQLSQLSPPPLVKINLSPENSRRSDNACCSSSCASCYNYGSIGFSNNVSASMQGANLTTNGSSSSLAAKISPTTNSIANLLNSPPSLGSSPNQSKSGLSLLSQMSPPHFSSIQSQFMPTQMNRQELTSSIKQFEQRENHQNEIGCANQQPQTEIEDEIPSRARFKSEKLQRVCFDEQRKQQDMSLNGIIQELSRKLETQAQENQKLKDNLVKEKSRSQMILTENLSVKEELKKAQNKLKEYESLQNMRQSQFQSTSQRASWLKTSPLKKNVGLSSQKSGFQQRKQSGQINGQCQLINNQEEDPSEFSLDDKNNIFESHHLGVNSPLGKLAESTPLEQQQLSQLSILDILNNLNYQEDNHLNESFYPENQQKPKPILNQLHQNQPKRRLNLVPQSFQRIDQTRSNTAKKQYK